MPTKSSSLLHLDPLQIALERRKEREAAQPTPSENRTPPESQPPANPEPVRNVTPVEIRTPPKPEPEPLRTEPLRKSAAVVLERDAPHLKIPYDVWKNAFRGRKPQQRVLLEELYRASAGWHSDECVISIGTLVKHTGMEKTQVREHLKRLYAEGIVEKLGDVVGGGDKDARGIRFRVNLPRMPPPEIRTGSENRPPRKTEANKKSDLKDRSKGDSASPNRKADPNCELCHGSGHPFRDGKVVMSEPCQCRLR
jgi:DNA-binding transcriptional ArsR family regulator